MILLLCVCFLCVPVRAAEEERIVALTFDDGPSGRFTRKLLDGLEKRNARATFLLCGYRIEVYPELAERILREGHEIGLHGYSHCSMSEMSPGELEEEIRKTMQLLPDGCEATFLRPPGGSGGDNTCAAAKKWELSVLYWSVDPKDWATSDASLIVRRVIQKVQDGDVILLHDMSDSSVNAALEIVDTLQRRGFRFVTVSELAEAKGITPTPGGNYYAFQ